jgi:hypothetical protein
VVAIVMTAVAAHRRFPWIPPPYLVALLVLPVAAWRAARWRTARGAVRWVAAGSAALAFVALLPVPWMVADLDHPPGNAWRLDGRLTVNGTTLDPPGSWYWLTVGRPPIVAEIVRGWLPGGDGTPTNMIGGRRVMRPAVAEPAAAAIGLRRAGWPIDLGVVVEATDPIVDQLPSRAVLTMVNGLALTTRAAWELALSGLREQNTFTTVGGASYEFQGPAMPFRHVDVIDAPEAGFDAAVGGPLARTLPGSWFRELALGSSHGLMVALVAYAHGSGEDLAHGRSIAGTGRIRGDGSVHAIGGLWAKATAARDIGADVLLFPAEQEAMLRHFDAGSMHLLPVGSLDEAIGALNGVVPGER